MKRFAILSASIAVSLTAQAADKINFADHVLPVFRNACLNCHNPDKKKAGLDLSTYQGTLQGSENGKVVQSGNAAASLLFKCVKQTEEPKMPPKGDKLSDSELAIVEQWIAGQLLETATGKAVAAAANNVQVATVSLTKPDGPPPMPGELSLEPVVRTRAANALTALAVSPWAPVVAVGGQRQIVLYHTETLQPLGVLPFPEGFPAIIRFSRNGALLLTGGGLGGKSGKVVLWDIKTGDRIATLGDEVDQVLAADLSADQQFVALGGPNKLVKIFATKDGKLVASIKKHTDWITAISFSPDGKFLATADRNGGVQLWEGATGKEYNSLPGHKMMVTGLAFMPGVLASASEDGKVSLWDVKEGKEIRSWAAHAGGAAWVDFTPDGRLVTAGRDKIAKVWSQDGKKLAETPPFADIALRAGLSSERVIAGDWTGNIRVSGMDGKPLGELSANPPSLIDRLADATKRLETAQRSVSDLRTQFAAAELKLKTEQAASDAKTLSQNAVAGAGDLGAKLAQLNTDLAKLRELRAGKPAESPEWTEANAKVQAAKAELAQTQSAFEAAAKTPSVAAASVAPDDTAVAKARAALSEAEAQVVVIQAELNRWRLAQVFQGAYNSRATLAEKKAQREALVQAVKDALQPTEKIGADLAAAEKALSEWPAKLKEVEAAHTLAQQAIETTSRTEASAKAAVAQQETALKALIAASSQPDARAELAKKLEAQTAEVAKLREARAGKASGTPEWTAADQLVQTKKAEIAQTQTALDAAPGLPAAPTKEAVKAAESELARLKDEVTKHQTDLKVLTDKAATASKELSKTKAAGPQLETQIAKLKTEVPVVAQTALKAKTKAELALASFEKEVVAAQAQAEKARAEYDALKNASNSSTPQQAAQPKS